MNLNIQKLKRTYNRGEVGLKEFNLNAYPGEVIAILGPNGAGKTTMIQSVLNWIDAEAGDVEFFGKLNMKDHREKILQRVGYVSDEPHLVEKYTVDQMIEMIRGHYIFWDLDYENELIEKFSLRRNEKIKNLSRGMKTKLSFLLALCYRPDLLIMDEATSGLDPRVREEVLRMLVEYCSEFNKTVLYATHLLDEVNRIATRVLILNKGEVAFEAATDEMDSRLASVSKEEWTKIGISKGEGLLGLYKDQVILDMELCQKNIKERVEDLEFANVQLDELFLGITGEDHLCL